MAWISLLFLIMTVQAKPLERFLTKHSSETLRFVNSDGRFAYVTKKPGVLGLVSNFRSTDFLSEANANDFIVKGSLSKNRLVIESIPNAQDDMSLLKNNKLFVVDFGNTVTREVGKGRGARLHVKDEWLTFYDVSTRTIQVQNLVTQKKYEIKVSKKPNPFFVPEVVMVSARSLVYTDINEAGYAALVSFDLETQKSTVHYKSSQNGTKLELCQGADYLALGEFPYDGVSRGSKILISPLSGVMNLSTMHTLYSSVEQDIGNMICLDSYIYFIKTMNQDRDINLKVTEAVKLDFKTQNIEAKSSMKAVTQLIEMDGRVMIPFRGDFYVLEGRANLGDDTLKAVPTKEELQIDI